MTETLMLDPRTETYFRIQSSQQAKVSLAVGYSTALNAASERLALNNVLSEQGTIIERYLHASVLPSRIQALLGILKV